MRNCFKHAKKTFQMVVKFKSGVAFGLGDNITCHRPKFAAAQHMIDRFRDRAHDTVGLMICFLGSSTHRQFFPRRFAHEVFLLSRHFKLLEIKLLPHPRFLLFLQRIQWLHGCQYFGTRLYPGPWEILDGQVLGRRRRTSVR